MKSYLYARLLYLRIFGSAVLVLPFYFIVSEALKDLLQDAKIHTDILGSDHCPVELDIRFE